MTFPDDALKDKAHRNYRNRQFWLKLSTGQTENDLIANELPQQGGYAPVNFNITTDGQIQAAASPLPRRWEMDEQSFSFTASGQALAYDSAFIMADAETIGGGGILYDYEIFDSTQTILDGQTGTVTHQFIEFDGSPFAV